MAISCRVSRETAEETQATLDLACRRLLIGQASTLAIPNPATPLSSWPRDGFVKGDFYDNTPPLRRGANFVCSAWF